MHNVIYIGPKIFITVQHSSRKENRYRNVSNTLKEIGDKVTDKREIVGRNDSCLYELNIRCH
jgi:hypothetical protein